MSYGNYVLEYSYSVPYGGDSEVDGWHDRHSSHFAPAQRSTVNPTQLLHQPRTYEASRSHNSGQRHHTSHRNHDASVYVSQPILPNVPVMRSSSEMDDYEFQGQIYENPQVLVEYRSRPSKSQRYYCEFEHCIDPASGVRKSVSRRADLKRHVHSVHGRPSIDCEYKKCGRRGEDGFCRPDHYREHLRGYHGQEVPRAPGRRRDS